MNHDGLISLLIEESFLDFYYFGIDTVFSRAADSRPPPAARAGNASTAC
jgi:hypothetical protein